MSDGTACPFLLCKTEDDLRELLRRVVTDPELGAKYSDVVGLLKKLCPSATPPTPSDDDAETLRTTGGETCCVGGSCPI